MLGGGNIFLGLLGNVGDTVNTFGTSVPGYDIDGTSDRIDGTSDGIDGTGTGSSGYVFGFNTWESRGF